MFSRAIKSGLKKLLVVLLVIAALVMKKAGKRKVKAIGVISGLIMTISFFSMASNPLNETGEIVAIIAATTMILSGIIFSLSHTYLDYIKERK